MIKEVINGKTYNLPGSLSDWQKKMYVYLIDWKKEYITDVKGVYKKKINGVVKEYEYDAILPEFVHANNPLIYPPILDDLKQHRALPGFNFRMHIHFNHMASSQAANVNLFLPILLHQQANDILSILKPDFKSLATNELFKGFRIEFWDGNSNEKRGLLKDHSTLSGTDSDIAIAYYNHSNELCLWLIEHKLTEKEFSQCGGFKSKDRDKAKHLCEKSFSEILANKNYCFHHSFKGREYWNLTDEKKSFFVNHAKHHSCPFKGGMNQLWRNQLLGFALEKAGMYKDVYFSVVKHPDNKALDKSIEQYQDLIDHNKKFSVLNSKNVIDSASSINDNELNKWIEWYKKLYKI